MRLHRNVLFVSVQSPPLGNQMSMIDTEDGNLSNSLIVNLEVINDVCEPAIDVSNIVLEESYTYTIGSGS